MLKGELSNEMGPAMGLRFERVIKTEEGKLNRAAKGFLERIFGATEINVYIITTNDRRKAMAFCLKWNVPYSYVIQADSLLEVPDIVREHDMMTYYDLDRDVVQNVNSRGHGKVDAKLWTSVQL